MNDPDPAGNSLRVRTPNWPEIQDPLPGAVLAAHPRQAFVAGGLPGQMGLHRGHGLGQILGVDESLPFTQMVADVRRLIAKHAFPGGGEVQPVSVEVPVPETMTGAIQGPLPDAFALQAGIRLPRRGQGSRPPRSHPPSGPVSPQRAAAHLPRPAWPGTCRHRHAGTARWRPGHGRERGRRRYWPRCSGSGQPAQRAGPG